ncbi:MAG: CoB--CoM heterodisulfide reductase iron-sulfur subunit B family protein [Promethearchaeota archaeon]
MAYKMFWGCVIANRLPFIESASRQAMAKLEFESEDFPEASCCPDPVGGQSTSHKAWLALGARNLAIAEAAGASLVSPCNGCVETFKSVNYFMEEDEHEKEEINEVLAKVNKSYSGATEVKHLIDVLYEDIGLDKVRAAVTNPLTGLRVACHYGCHYMRPSAVVKGEDPFNPTHLDELVEALGAIPVEYEDKLACCGNGTSKTDDEVGSRMTLAKLDSMTAAKADCIAVICPACFLQLDGTQRNINKVFHRDFGLPVFYFTELLALAMGIPGDSFGAKFHSVKTKDILARLNPAAAE